jgi:S1-C subfamily serine protease
VVPNSPAEEAGLLMGDILLMGAGQPLTDSDSLEEVITANTDIPTEFLVLRDGEELTLTITPRMNEQAGRPLIGIGF